MAGRHRAAPGSCALALGVAGRYYLDGTLAKGMERALKVVESLVAGIRSGK